jgi:hypothetical protein
MFEATTEGQEYTKRTFPIDAGYFQVVRRAMEEPPDGYVFDALERRAGELWVTYRKEPADFE